MTLRWKRPCKKFERDMQLGGSRTKPGRPSHRGQLRPLAALNRPEVRTQPADSRMRSVELG
jgi:hypothetical protein